MFTLSCQDSVRIGRLTVIIWMHLQLHVAQANSGLVLPEERTTGLGCIPEGRNVSYQCTVIDTTNPPIGITIWMGSAFLNQCPENSDQITFSPSQFTEMMTVFCGTLKATPLYINGSNYVSQLSLRATTKLNGTTLSCSLGPRTIGDDVITVGVPPPPPGPLTIPPFSGLSLTVSWSPPSGSVEGEVGGYMFSVTGEGCGCVSMKVSGDTTSVTCSGWTAAGQTCFFEVRTLSQDCEFISDPVNKTETLAAQPDLATIIVPLVTVVAIGLTVIILTVIAIIWKRHSSSSDRNALSMSTLNFTENKTAAAPVALHRSIDAVSHNHIAFFRQYGARSISMYNSSTDEWSSLPEECPVEHTALAILRIQDEFHLHTVGGTLQVDNGGDASTQLVDHFYRHPPRIFRERQIIEANDICWEETQFPPPMQEKREQVVALCCEQTLIVAGGCGRKGKTTTVETLNLENTNNKWSYVADLPRPLCRPSGCTTLNRSLYILGGYELDKRSKDQIATRSAYKTSLTLLCQSHKGDKRVFTRIKDVPLPHSAYTTFSDQIYAVGGSEGFKEPQVLEAKSSRKVFRYNPKRNVWDPVNSLNTPRSDCFAVSIQGHRDTTSQLMVVGGYTRHYRLPTNSVEIGDLKAASLELF